MPAPTTRTHFIQQFDVEGARLLGLLSAAELKRASYNRERGNASPCAMDMARPYLCHVPHQPYL